MEQQSKPKQINVSIIERDGDTGPRQTYRIMDELIGAFHPHLADAKIAMAWRYKWSEDADGRLKLGQARKASDLDNALHGYDFIILLNYEALNAAEFTDIQLTALIDHELMHCQVTVDEDGVEKRDEHGRPVWRTRGHDVEEFVEIADRYGAWTCGLEKLAKAALAAKAAPLTAPSMKIGPTTSGTLSAGECSVTITQAGAKRIAKNIDRILKDRMAERESPEDTFITLLNLPTDLNTRLESAKVYTIERAKGLIGAGKLANTAELTSDELDAVKAAIHEFDRTQVATATA